MRPALALLLAMPLPACKKEGCLTGNDADCVVPSPCARLDFTCDDGFVALRVLEAGDPALQPGNPLALAAPGDILLENAHTRVVVEALDHPHYLGPTGGGIVDLSTDNEDNDSLRSIFHGTGLLPTEAFHYTDLRTFEQDGFVAVQVNGTLDGFPDIRVATRYELRPCDPGVRVRTEVVNRTPDPQTWFLTDAWYWGGRELLPFTSGAGFDHPSFGLTTVLEAFADVRYMVAGTHTEPSATYATVACDAESLTGFQSAEVTATGTPNRVVQPRDYEVFERFHVVVDGPVVSKAVDRVLEIRRYLFGEKVGTLSGTITTPAGPTHFGDLLRASIHVREVVPDGAPVAWTHTVPKADGTFEVKVPAGKEWLLEVESYGRIVATKRVGRGPEVGEIEIPAVGQLTIDATVNGVPDHVLAFVHPADDATAEASRGRLLGNFEECAPLLGHPHGPSPACNRVLVDGPVTVPIVPGTYHVAAAAGLFGTLAVARDVVIPPGGSAEVLLALDTLDLQPPGTLGADFHVHGAASFDAMLPDEDRVRSFAASRLDVVVATEHDASWSYERAIRDLGLADRMRLVVGTESTGHVLMPLLDTTYIPKVIGHWNAWPLPFDPEAPWHGAPWDELVQPGQLFDRYVDAGWSEAHGVLQLNHPVGGAQLGRDFGWVSALEMDLTRPPGMGEGGNALFDEVPEGSAFSNADYHVQEVMNGTANLTYLQYRAFWHYLLDHGYLRGGTANSDSHTLTENVMGVPRTLVTTPTTVADFDTDAFDRAVREGRMVGTNGPVITVSVPGADGKPHGPLLLPFAPDEAGALRVTVTAAPWVPVDEVRVVVNSEVVATLEVDALPFAATLPLADLLPPQGDAWLVVEAGAPLVPNADLDCDGIPDTGDNNADGRIDWRDVAELDEEPEEPCVDVSGPLTEPPPPERDTPLWTYQLVVPGGYPSAFTNPLIFDRDGDDVYAGVPR